MFDLPPELVFAILDLTEDGSVLFALRSLSKRFDAMVTPLAFRTLTVRDSVRSAGALVSLQNCDTAITSAVQEIVFKAENQHIDSVDGQAARDAVYAAFSRLSKFSNLKSLRLQFYHGWSLTPSQDVPPLHLQTTLFGALAAHRPPPLASLTIHNLVALPAPAYTETAFQNIFRTLITLHLSTYPEPYLDNDNAYDRDFPPLRDFWNICVPHMLKSAPHLTSLTIHSDRWIGVGPVVPFADIHLPALAALSLRYFVFHPADPATDVLEFIVRHKGTLTHLELENCTVYGGPNHRKECPRPWHVMLRRLERELPRLRSLRVTVTGFAFLAPRPCGYLLLVPWNSYSHTVADVFGVRAQDDDALASLISRVESRRAMEL
ncbi:hypothetical protein B0H16DRAFT_1591160 [Mycena metata]|uniref:F-box domain-containing protein n=1 Tax=Mycena metata TaxID=1033252 RepID=A0AAD7MPQ6_9AGAR|nr:hypothetical protein B0H16DRAFT_1591160 [Mycena metata]